jgi:hypothetical protein
VGGSTHLCQVLEHLRAQLAQVCIQGSFDLPKRGLGMLLAPLAHARQKG